MSWKLLFTFVWSYAAMLVVYFALCWAAGKQPNDVGELGTLVTAAMYTILEAVREKREP